MVVYLGVSADGADDGVRRQFQEDIFGLFEDGVKGIGESALALLGEAGGAGVSADGGMVGDTEVLGDFACAAPAQEVALDVVTVRMTADLALAAMAIESWLTSGGFRVGTVDRWTSGASDGLRVWMGFQEPFQVFEVGVRHS